MYKYIYICTYTYACMYMHISKYNCPLKWIRYSHQNVFIFTCLRIVISPFGNGNIVFRGLPKTHLPEMTKGTGSGAGVTLQHQHSAFTVSALVSWAVGCQAPDFSHGTWSSKGAQENTLL